MRAWLRLAIAASLLLAGPAWAQEDEPAPDPRAERAELAPKIEALRERLAGPGPGDPSADALRSELGLLERLDSLLLREQTLLENQQRLERAEAAMQQKLAAGPESDVTDTPPYPIALLDLLGDAVAALERQRAVLESAEQAAEAALQSARSEREEAARERRRRVDELERATSAVEKARARAALQLAELRQRIARARTEVAALELDAARRDRTLQDHNLALTRSVLYFVEQQLDLTPELRAELLLGIQQRERELRRERERASLDLERAQARRLAAEQRRDRQQELTPAIVAENEALGARQETLQVRVATLGQQEERLARVRELRDRRYRTLAGEASRPQMREWAAELRGFAAELERRRQVEKGRLAQLASMRDAVEASTAEVDAGAPRQRWMQEHLDALTDRQAIHESEIADLEAVREQAERFLGELERRTAQMNLADRIEIARRWVAEVWDTELASLEDRPITIGKVATALLLLIGGLVFARLLSTWLVRATARRMSLEEGATAAFQSLSYYLLALIFLLIALRSANIPLTVFTILGGAFAIGVGFGSQNIIANFISGLILLVERPIKVGDMIEIDSSLGRVEGIGLRATRVRTFDNIHIIVPNSAFLERNVVNWNLRDDIVRGRVEVGVAYGSPTRTVEQLLLQAAEEHRLVLDDPAPTVLFTNFGSDALEFRLFLWVHARNVLDRVRIESELRYRIDELFRESEIVIAFPQRDVHLDTTRPLRLEWSKPGSDEKEDPDRAQGPDAADGPPARDS